MKKNKSFLLSLKYQNLLDNLGYFSKLIKTTGETSSWRIRTVSLLFARGG